MDNKIFKILFTVIGVCLVAFLVFLYGPKTAEATYQEHKVTICHKGQTIEVSAIAALHHLRQHEEDYRGECKQEEPKDYCEYIEGVQGEDEDCPKPEPTCEELQNCEPEEPPVVVDRDDDEDNQKCEAPGKVQGFRYQFVGASNRLRWEPKGSVDKVDIAVYGMDKTTLLYNVRTDDDGEYFIPSHTTWHKIRAVGNCGLSSWSKLIN